MKRIAVLGAGSWGLTLARFLRMKGHEVHIWDFDPARVQRLDAERSDEARLPGVDIPSDMVFHTDIEGCLEGADVCVIVVPSHGFRATVERASDLLPDTVVSATKGLELETGKTMSQVAKEIIPEIKIAVLTGPSIAREVARGLPCSVVAASDSPETARQVQEIFSWANLRVYRGDDVLGAELGGALKNVVALACGMADGMGLGYNAKSALLTRGLAEIMRLASAMGAAPKTLSGLAGVGDLVTTCFCPHSRNRTLGERIGKGQPPGQALGSMIEVAEGVNTARSARREAARLGVEAPITGVVNDILEEKTKPEEALRGLMARPLREEFYGIKEIEGYG